MKKNVTILFAIIIIAVFIAGGYLGYKYYSTQQKQVACTQEAKICPDGSSVGRSGPKCEFAPCPDYTAGWNALNNDEFAFSIKYPNNFFGVGHEPKILVGDCNYSKFPDVCPKIDNILSENNDMGDYQISNNGQSTKLNINNNLYCLSQAGDAGMGHVYNYYYYITVKNQKCLVVAFNTNTDNCDFYLPLEPGNTVQANNYNNCVTTNKNQPIILNEIINTFKFNK